MKILIINQPVANRGDESAHRALLRKLSVTYPESSINVVYFGEIYENAKPMEVNCKNVSYDYIEFEKGLISIAYYSIRYKLCGLATTLLSAYRELDNKIKDSDYVICAPGGICLGGFMDWNHLFWLLRAKAYKKKLAYYSRSFGPFNSLSSRSVLFKEKSLEILKYFSFLSIRDGKTMELAKQLGLNYVPSIDTAFLESPLQKDEFLSLSLPDDYVVFVPNSLTWHNAYRNANAHDIMAFYEKIIDLLSAKFVNAKIVMLPQLFGQIANSDYLYFKSVQENSKNKNKIIVLQDNLSSDVQQTIIKNSKFVVGARYHSIVFAINNSVPFASLSYEHKMFGLVEILTLENRQIDITNIGTDCFDSKSSISMLKSILDSEIDIADSCSKAHQIALNCFNNLRVTFLK